MFTSPYSRREKKLSEAKLYCLVKKESGISVFSENFLFLIFNPWFCFENVKNKTYKATVQDKMKPPPGKFFKVHGYLCQIEKKGKFWLFGVVPNLLYNKLY